MPKLTNFPPKQKEKMAYNYIKKGHYVGEELGEGEMGFDGAPEVRIRVDQNHQKADVIC